MEFACVERCRANAMILLGGCSRPRPMSTASPPKTVLWRTSESASTYKPAVLTTSALRPFCCPFSLCNSQKCLSPLVQRSSLFQTTLFLRVTRMHVRRRRTHTQDVCKNRRTHSCMQAQTQTRAHTITRIQTAHMQTAGFAAWHRWRIRPCSVLTFV